MDPTTTDPTPPATPPQPKFLDRPLVKEAIRIGIAVLLAHLAGKGIKLPGEGAPAVVNVSYTPHDAPTK